MKRRRHIPVGVRLQVALRQLAGLLGCEVKDLRLDHDPALVLRPLNTRKTDTVPPANSPAHLSYLPTLTHDTKTFGPGGSSRITTRGGDIHTAARIERLAEKRAEFQRRMAMGSVRHTEVKPSKWPKRTMRKP